MTHTNALDRDSGSRLLALARESVRRTARGETHPTPEGTDPALDAELGVFVTLERDGDLRGCVGRPRADDPLRTVVVEAAADAAANDPRFGAVSPAVVPDLEISVTVLSAPEEIPADTDHVVVGRDGLVVSQGRSRGLLLPQVAVDNDWDPAQLLTATCRKAGLPGVAWRRGDVTVERFTGREFRETADGLRVHRYDETDSDGTVRHAVTDGGVEQSVRRPAVAGEFYADTESELCEQVVGCFTHDLGPGQRVGTVAGPTPRFIVAPHAGYPYSGPIAAHGYDRLAAGSPDVAIVFGPNHDGGGEDVAVAPHDRWLTPFGALPVAADIAQRLVAESDDASFDTRAHEGEHSIEVQLPFLQHCGVTAVVPVCLGRIGAERARRLGQRVATVAADADRDVVTVASTDLTHYEPDAVAREADEPVVDALAAGDPDTVIDAKRHGHTMCGPWGAVAGLTAAAALDCTAGETLAYATSADTAGTPARVVGYASVARW
ncbi:AmmeMemoRadiSam system protein B [Halosegnis longus]|uniref:AmmeMemoRadiSam system protein B n=1 Tax=Halosegnis longus TaxID=2216012 RepID=UPI00129E6C59|nr:AmmeMemoRadiSam system protein B [Halosegnis longus]